METSLIPAVCKLMTENGVLSDAMWTNNLKNTVISGAKTKSGSLETVDGPCCGLLGDAPGQLLLNTKRRCRPICRLNNIAEREAAMKAAEEQGLF